MEERRGETTAGRDNVPPAIEQKSDMNDPHPEEDVRKMLQDAMAKHQSGQLDDAERLYQRVLQSDEQNVQARRLWGILARERGDLAGSLEILNKSSGGTDEDPDLLCELALTHFAAGHLQIANTLLHQVLARKPDSLKTLANLGALLQYTGHINEAITYHQRVVDMDPSDLEVRYNLAKSLVDAGRGDEAIAECESVVAMTSGQPFALSIKGSVLCDLEQFEAAAEVLEQAVAADPANDLALISLGYAQRQLGKPDLAAETLRQAVKINPHNAGSTAELINILTAQDRQQEALTLGENFLIRHRGERMVLAAYAYALRDAGREDEAHALLDFDQLIHVIDLEKPTGFKSLDSFNQSLAGLITGHPSLLFSPKSKATHGGGQTGELNFDDDAALSALGALIHKAVMDRAESFRGADIADQTLMAHPPENWSIRVWGTVLESEGCQTPHNHPLGWLSGVYYVQLPSDMAQAGWQSGWLEFGAPPERYMVAREPALRAVEPKEGRLVLFPSYFYHRTKPFRSSGSRVSIAFDVVPSSVPVPATA